jgi:short-subunit dehydrogenase
LKRSQATRVAFITGASSGIGYATALEFARQGVHVAVIARRAERLKALEQAVHALPQPHGEVITFAADVRDANAMLAAASLAAKRFGRLDILVANAGVGQRGSIVDSDWEHLETLLRTNIDGVLHIIRATVPEMRKNGGNRSDSCGHIIIISSIVANMTTPYAAAYSASKAFVSSIARSLRLELEPDHIWVTDMLLGRTVSEFNEKRLGQAGYADTAAHLPRMTAEKVAKAIVKAARQRRKTVVLRPFDRLILWANALVPGLVARRALRQYKTF